MRKYFLLLFALVAAIPLFPQIRGNNIVVTVEPDHQDWHYQTGETAKFQIEVRRSGTLLSDVSIDYASGPEMYQTEKKSLTLKDGTLQLKGTMKQPGFYRVDVVAHVDGKDYKQACAAAFAPEQLQPSTVMPQDFEQFWSNAIDKAAQVPMLTTVTRNEKESNDKVDVFYVKIQSYKAGNYVYGVLTVPKSPGRKPAILRLPGAAVRPFNGPNELAYEGFVVLDIGVHGIPVDQDKEIYRQLENGALAGYTTIGIDNRDTYYYKRSILGCVRAVDYLCTRDDVDTTRIATYGGSQGGMLSIMTAALSPHVSALFSYFPAFCDLTGYYYGRGAGWPHLFRDPNEPNLQARMEVSKYYDTVNFARLLKVPGFYAWGFNDPACCPTSTFSAYNVITAPKQLQVGRDTGHWLYPWQVENAMKWLKLQFHMTH